MRTLAIVFALCLIGCSKDADPIAPPATMTGTWDVTISNVGGSVSGLLTITENHGSIGGTFQIGTVSNSVSGTVSVAGSYTMGMQDRYYYIMTGTTNEDRSSFSGSMTVKDLNTNPPTVMGTFSTSGAKR